jgi:putative intracellular protease/amidase
MKKKVHLFVFDDFADWEPSFVTPEINKSEHHQIETVGLTMQPVKSMGGLTVIPDTTVAAINWQQAAMLILPGSDRWTAKELREVNPAVENFRKKNLPIAAICAATAYLADIGFFQNVAHTSNNKEWLNTVVPGYKGSELYKEEMAITDGNIISANGIGPIEFAREIMKKLKIYSDADLDKWFQLFKHGVWTP